MFRYRPARDDPVGFAARAARSSPEAALNCIYYRQTTYRPLPILVDGHLWWLPPLDLRMMIQVNPNLTEKEKKKNSLP